MKDHSMPAFPVPIYHSDDADDGMTLRDYFAAKALPLGWEVEKESPTGPFREPMEPTYLGAAQRAYNFADAMMKAREIK